MRKQPVSERFVFRAHGYSKLLLHETFLEEVSVRCICLARKEEKMKENQNFDTEINGNTALQREKPDYQQEILHILRSKNSPKVIRDELEDYHENDIASVLPKLDLKERESLYRLLSVERLSDILEFADDGETYINELDLKKQLRSLKIWNRMWQWSCCAR